MTIKKKLIWLVILATVFRCIASLSVELGNDEVYYLSYARHLQWNYFDHPPIVALLIRITTCNLLFTNEFFVRLGPIILSAINTILIFRLATKLRDERSGLIAAILFTGSPYCSILTGVFILPDTPQLFFWIAGITILIEIGWQRLNVHHLNYLLLLFGFTAGACIMCKVHGVFLWVGFGAYILIYQRSLLRNGYLYLAALITVVVVSPIIIWNSQNNFIMFTFHSNRIVINSGLDIESFIRELAGSILYNNPVTFFLIVLCLKSVLKTNESIPPSSKRLLLLLSLPLIILLLFMSLFRDTLPHWSGPAYIPLIIMASCHISFVTSTNKISASKLRRLVSMSLLLISMVAIVSILLINFMPGTFGKKDPEVMGAGDFSLDMYGWKALKGEFKNIHDSNSKAGVSSSSYIISNKWFPAAHIDNYIAQPLHLDFIALGELNDIHTYAWLNKYRKKLKHGDDAYFLTLSDNFCDPRQKYKSLFEEIDKPAIVQQCRGGKPVRKVLIYLLRRYKGD